MSLHKIKVKQVRINPLFDPLRNQTNLGEDAQPFIIIKGEVLDQAGREILANKVCADPNEQFEIEHRIMPPQGTYEQIRAYANAFAHHIGNVIQLECNVNNF